MNHAKSIIRVINKRIGKQASHHPRAGRMILFADSGEAARQGGFVFLVASVSIAATARYYSGTAVDSWIGVLYQGWPETTYRVLAADVF